MSTASDPVSAGVEAQTASGYQLIAWAFLRLLGLIYAAAFASLAVQILGLAGTQGIYPLAEQLQQVSEQYGLLRWLAYPSLFWLASGDWALLAVAWGGAGLGLLLAAWPWVGQGRWTGAPSVKGPLLRPLFWIGRSGVWGERVLLGLLYVSYLSLVYAGQVFTNFQWDFLLLEAGFLALFLPGANLAGQRGICPTSGPPEGQAKRNWASAWWTSLRSSTLQGVWVLAGTPMIVWLFRWLLFRLRFESGLAKLLSGDPSWRDLTAVTHYLETQPLPHIGAWYAHQLPDWLLRLGTLGTLVVELILPFLILMPRPWRLIAAWLTILWQVLIIATSNHNFFNLLTIALCLFLFEDRDLRWLRGVAVGWMSEGQTQRWISLRSSSLPYLSPLALAHPLPVLILALILVPVSLINAAELILRRPIEPLSGWAIWVNRFYIANRYHVFPEIPKTRLEVEIEVSQNGQGWVGLDFRYRPDRLDQAPPWIIPHQPRLDWVLWFVPQHPLFLEPFERFLRRLQEGARPVIALLARPPFAEGSPRLVRAQVWRYRFTTAQERAATGDWWRRDYLGPFHWGLGF